MDYKKQKLKYLIMAIVAGFLAYFILGPMSGLDESGRRYIGILIFIVIVWCTEAVSYPVSGLVLVILMMFGESTGKVKFSQGLKVALSGFGSATPIALLSATGFALAVKNTGLSERVVYKIMKVLAGHGHVTVNRFLASIFCIEVPLSILVPSTAARTVTYLSIVEGLRNALGFAPLDDNGNIVPGTNPNPIQRAMYIVTGVMPAITGAAFLTGAEATMLAGRLIAEGTGTQQYWGLTFAYLFAPAMVMMVAFYFIASRTFPSSVPTLETSFVDEKIKAMGPMNWGEKYCLITFVIALVLWMTDKMTGIPAEAVLILMTILMFVPHIGPGNWKTDCKNMAWGSFIVVATSVTFATALGKHGVMKLVANQVAGLGITSYVGIMFVLICVLVVLRLAIASHTGATVLFVPLSIELGKMAGFSTPQLVALAWTIYVFCRSAYLLPQQSAQVIICYDYGFFNRKDMMKMGIRLVGASIVIYMIWGNLILPYIAAALT